MAKRRIHIREHPRRAYKKRNGTVVSRTTVTDHDRILEAKRKWNLMTPFQKSMVRMSRQKDFYRLRSDVLAQRIRAPILIEGLRKLKLINIRDYVSLKQSMGSSNQITRERGMNETLDIMERLSKSQDRNVIGKFHAFTSALPSPGLRITSPADIRAAKYKAEKVYEESAKLQSEAMVLEKAEKAERISKEKEAERGIFLARVTKSSEIAKAEREGKLVEAKAKKLKAERLKIMSEKEALRKAAGLGKTIPKEVKEEKPKKVRAPPGTDIEKFLRIVAEANKRQKEMGAAGYV